MKKALLLGVAALLMLGCSAADYKNKSMKTVKPAVIKGSSATLASASAATMDQAQPAYAAQKRNRPTQHQMAVHRHHDNQHKRLQYNHQWKIEEPKLTGRQKELVKIVKDKMQSAMNASGEPGPNRMWTPKKKREAMERMQKMREGLMNTLDQPQANWRNRVDIKPSDINNARMPGNGLVGMPAGGNDHYIRASECPNNRCINSARSQSGRMQRLANTLD